jgi:hypothetical protein
MAEPTVFSYTFLDKDAVKAPIPYYAGYNGAVETVNGLVGTWTALGGLLDACSDAQIIGGRITIPVAPDAGWKSAPAAGAYNPRGALINFTQANVTRPWGAQIPSLILAAVVNSKLDLTNAAIAALTAELIAGFTNGSFVSNYSNDLAAVRDGFLNTRKHRRQLDRSIATP